MLDMMTPIHFEPVNGRYAPEQSESRLYTSRYIHHIQYIPFTHIRAGSPINNNSRDAKAGVKMGLVSCNKRGQVHAGVGNVTFHRAPQSVHPPLLRRSDKDLPRNTAAEPQRTYLSQHGIYLIVCVYIVYISCICVWHYTCISFGQVCMPPLAALACTSKSSRRQNGR